MANGSTGESVAHAPAELLVRAAAHALLPLGIRPCLELRERAGRHRALAVGEVHDPPREHLDFTLAVARLGILVGA